MEYLHIELKGFKRLKLRNIQHIILKPNNKIQLILGSNGSGKSSLVAEISPLPGNTSDYEKEGFKYIEFKHNNSYYKLRSSFNSTGNEFSFIKDDEELNPGFTMTTYKMLVKQHFNITADIQDILTGVNRFSLMSVSERRSWFTRISNTDYTYAIQYYNRVKDSQRDSTGSIKTLQSRLVQESSKILTPDAEIKLREELKILNEGLTSILEMRMPFNKSVSELSRNLDDSSSSMTDQIAHYKKLRKVFADIPENFDLKNIREYIAEQQATVYHLNQTSVQLCEELDKDISLHKTIVTNNVSSLEDIDKSIRDYEEELGMLYKRIKYNFKFENTQNALSALNSIEAILVEICATISSNEEKQYSRDTYAKAVEAVAIHQDKVKVGENKLALLLAKRKELEHLKTHDQVECPKCSHKWTRNYSERDEQFNEEAIASTIAKMNEYKIALKAYEELVETIKTYLELYRSYNSITTSTEALRPLWNYILEKELFFKNPRHISTLLDQVKLDLQYWISIDNINAKLKSTLELKSKLDSDQKLNLNALENKIEQQNQQLYQINLKIEQAEKAIKTYKLYETTLGQIDDIKNYIDVTLADYSDTYSDLIDEIRRSHLNEIIQHVQLAITDREQLLSKVDIQKALVADIQSQIVTQTERATLLKEAVKALSPTEGLIAKGLTGFINHFILQMNSFIKKIWLYPLEVLPVEVEEGEEIDLDYKFIVKVNDSFTIPDIAKGSFAMREIIDLAFKIVSMQHLGLENAPLILDEFAASFDHAHRDSAIFAITSLMTSSNFSQIYMISHYANSYGSLKNTDVTVLCPNNIVLPKDMAFNTVTSIS